MDYSKLSLTQAKRLEMESQVKALELEKELEMERTRLAELRKLHYHLAGASEGWEEVSLSLSHPVCNRNFFHAGTDRELAVILNSPCYIKTINFYCPSPMNTMYTVYTEFCYNFPRNY